MTDSLTVHFPWGSLLRGILGYDDAVLAGIARLLAPGAEATALVSVLPRDGTPPIPSSDALTRAYARHGLVLVETREATLAEVAGSHSSWAKRLRAGSERPVTLLRARTPAACMSARRRKPGQPRPRRSRWGTGDKCHCEVRTFGTTARPAVGLPSNHRWIGRNGG